MNMEGRRLHTRVQAVVYVKQAEGWDKESELSAGMAE
jgi:hypothetical protein